MSNSPKVFICAVCSHPFNGRRGFNKYCGEACRRSVGNLTRTKRRRISGSKETGAPTTCRRCSKVVPFRGRRSLYCEPCSKEVRADQRKAYWARNPERLREMERRKRERAKQNPSHIEWRRRYERAKRAAPRHKLTHRMSQLVRNSLSGGKGGATWQRLVGYTVQDLMAHLERQFLPGMTWANIGDWHIDHILPVAMFDYHTPQDPSFKACWALTNLRPLWSGENISKGAKRLFLI